jgi:hypothetical protein
MGSMIFGSWHQRWWWEYSIEGNPGIKITQWCKGAEKIGKVRSNNATGHGIPH